MFKKLTLILTAAALLMSVSPAAAAERRSMQDLFWRRAWGEMDLAYSSGGKRSAQDHSLMANAYRIRGMWPEAVGILEKHAQSFPASVRPYADMTLLLGLENLGRTKEALALADKLVKSSPDDIKYYAAYAQYRLAKKLGDAKRVESALFAMLRSASTDDRRINALKQIITLPGNRNDSALKLLELQPTNSAAAGILKKLKSPTNAQRTALGVNAYMTKDYKYASECLKPVNLTDGGGRKAAYYRAYALYNLKQHTEALNLWGRLALSGNTYSESSVRRIATLAGKAGKNERKSAITVLERVINERKGKVQARAMLVLADLLSKDDPKRKAAIEDRLLKAYPDTDYSFKVLWRRGTASFRKGDFAEAVRLWKLTDAPNINAARRARVLYWLSRAQRSAGRAADADASKALLLKRYPLSIYSYLIGGGRFSFRITDGVNTKLIGGQTELEQWGFALYARLKMSGPKATAKQLYRSLYLARWLGADDTYAEARRIESMLTTGGTLYRADLESLYPRPYISNVAAACASFDVEDNFVWSIMKQESAFRPAVRSHAGAAGLMQLMPATAKGEAKRAGLEKYDLDNPADNITLGVSHLAWLAKSFPRKDFIMAAYNAGGGNARKWIKEAGEKASPEDWIEAVRFDETCGYVQRVSANLEVYRMLYGGKK